ncbi:tetratricopeptide repeat-containing sulfotransferase family protein [Rheinheimera marina]|uniref:Tetratricopeptide repeat-containing sulfotransferase family protein n=1 Tax=Rheinheimera marina TaxID=1774958 RepID=A0ABV9JNS5_9GAMM
MLEQALAALKANDLASAEVLLLKALSSQTDRHGALRLLVRLYVSQNKLQQAIEFTEQLLADHPDNQDYYVSLAQFYQLEFQEQKLLQLWQQFVSKWPTEQKGWFNLVLSARRSRNAEVALTALARWFELTGDNGEFLFQQALVYSELLRQERKAMELLQQLLVLQPGHHGALFNLGHLSEQLGELTEATSYFYAACQSHPDDATSWARWLELAKLDKQQLQQHRVQLEALLSAPLNTSQIDLYYAFGLSYDRLGLYNEAWHCYQKANQGDSQFLPQYQPERTKQLIADCLRRDSAVWPKSQASALIPILICGMFRSGSTLAEQIIAASEQVACGGELEFLHRQLFPLIQQPEALVAKASESDFTAGYLEQIERLLQGRRYFTDKRPENFLYLDAVFYNFPAAKVIWTRRQLADNALSVYFHRLGPGMNYAANLDAILHYEQQQRQLMHHWQQRYPGQIFELDYDELVSQPTSVLQALFAFLGLHYNGEAERFYQLKHAVKTASVSQVRRPLYQHSSGRYRNYQAEILQSGLYPDYCLLLNSLATDHRE